jgi:hypothetical protein
MNMAESNKVLRIMFFISLFCIFIMSGSILLMPLASEMFFEGSNTLLIATGLMFWIPLFGGYVLLAVINSTRKKVAKKHKQHRLLRIGLIRFFSNIWAFAADLVFVISLIGFVVSMLNDPFSYFAFVLLFITVFSFQLHCILNGENYRFIFSYKTRTKQEGQPMKRIKRVRGKRIVTILLCIMMLEMLLPVGAMVGSLAAADDYTDVYTDEISDQEKPVEGADISIANDAEGFDADAPSDNDDRLSIQDVTDMDTFLSGNDFTIALSSIAATGFAFEDPNPDPITYGEPFINIANCYDCFPNCDGEITYEVIIGDDVASVNPTTGVLTTIKAGDIEVEATKSACDETGEQQTQYELTINKAPQAALVFSNPYPDDIPFSPTPGSFTNAASGGSGDGAITYSITVGNNVYATINEGNGAITTLKAGGPITVRATRATDDRYLVQTQEYNLEIYLAPRTGFYFAIANPGIIYFSPLSPHPTFTNTASGGEGTGNIIYEITSGETNASIDETTGAITTLGAGPITVRATKAADEQYAAATAEYSATIGKVPQAALVFEIPNPSPTPFTPTPGSFTNVASGGSGSGAITYEITSGGTNASIHETTGAITMLRAGTIIVRATRAEDDNYAVQTQYYTLEVTSLEQAELVFENPSPANIIYGTPNYTNEIAPTSGSGDGIVSYEIITGSSIADIDTETGELTFKNGQIGSVIVRATKAADYIYLVKTKDYTVTLVLRDTPSNPYEFSGETKNESGWYTGDVTVTPPVGYKISESNSFTEGTSSWADYIIYSTEGIHTYTVYLKEDSTGFITDAILIVDLKIDKTAPGHLEIRYSEPRSFFDAVLNAITFGYYSPSVTVTITAFDSASGVEYFDWKYTREPTASTSKLDEETGVKLPAVRIGNTSTYNAVFVLTGTEARQYRGSISFTATDIAGNKSEEKNDAENHVIIVDTIEPEAIISYVGPLKATVDAMRAPVWPADNNTRFIYSGMITATVEITDANFYPNYNRDALGYEEGGILITVSKELDGETSDYPLSYEKLCWDKKEGSDTWTLEFEIEGDGDYIVTVVYRNRSELGMNWSAYYDEYEGKSGSTTYTSNVMTIDTTDPIVNVTYSPAASSPNDEMYRTNRTATIQITDRNFHPNKLEPSFTAVNVQGNSIDAALLNIETKGETLKEWDSWDEVSMNVWEATIVFSEDANYMFRLDYTDLAGNEMETYEAEPFAIDRGAPTDLSISYSTPLFQMVIQAVTFGYYNPAVTVTLMANDDITGVGSFEWTYMRETDVSTELNTATEMARINTNGITYSNNGRTASASFTLTGNQAHQYRGSISFTANDNAGNNSATRNDAATHRVVIDTISPTRSVELPVPNKIVDAATMRDRNISDYVNVENSNSILYYDRDVTVTFIITEANFYEEDVVIEVRKDNGEFVAQTPVNWSQTTETDIWTGAITLSGNGDYWIRMSYTDRSNNEMTTYTSQRIVIDTINPVISVSYSPDNTVRELNGRKYYDVAQTATIVITERNFRADDVDAVITARNVAGSNVSTTLVNQLTAHLRNRNSWTSDGYRHTAVITYSADANYTFDISYQDLSLRSITPYATDVFTVDTTSPTGLTVSYSTNVLQTVLESITFGFYNAQMTVTISADDETAGIHNFAYSYITSPAVSTVNAGILNERIDAAGITYSDSGRRATTRFTIPRSILAGNNQFRGTVEFTANDRSDNNTNHRETTIIVVDNISPQATISFNAPVREFDGISYYDGEIIATFEINEANFYSEDVTVSVSKDGVDATIQNPTDWTQTPGTDIWTGTITLDAPADHSGDGDYIIIVEYTDKSENPAVFADRTETHRYTSNQLTIDTIIPEITVLGIRHESANKDDTIGFVITATDTNLDAGAFEPRLMALYRSADGGFTTEIISLGEGEVVEAGRAHSFTVDNLSRDAIYTLSATKTDMSGNQSDNIIVIDSENIALGNVVFSVNREGSTFLPDDNTMNLINAYYVQNVTANIVVDEINVDPLHEYTVEMNSRALAEGADYNVSIVNDSGTWSRYRYSIQSMLFSDENQYNVVISSTDKAGTKAYSDLKQAEIRFVVDRTAPTVEKSGIDNNARYQVESQLVTLIPRDEGGKLRSLSVQLVDSGNNTISRLINLEGDALLDALSENSGLVTFELSEGLNQNVSIVCIDEAGNEYNETYRNITVSTSWWILFYANTPLFVGSIVGVTAVTGAAIAIPIIKAGKLAAIKGKP